LPWTPPCVHLWAPRVHPTPSQSYLHNSTLFSLDGECVFPFWYKNKLFYDCIKYGMRHKWCSLNKTFEGHWKYCSETDFAPCVFPFWYERLIYWECTDDGDDFGRKWCSLTKNYNKDQAWKYC
uniref:Binder of sperm protein homolog 1 n=1 Tax=Marmota marmota marmota TaxID=9994 RepID=A0A8C5ZKF8_MARMA